VAVEPVAPVAVTPAAPADPAVVTLPSLLASVAPPSLPGGTAAPLKLPALLPKLARALSGSAAASPVPPGRPSGGEERESPDAEGARGASAPVPTPLRPLHKQLPSPAGPTVAPGVSSGGHGENVRMVLSGVLLIVALAAFAQTVRVGVGAPRVLLLADRLPRPG
jgi:hypothetical protein